MIFHEADSSKITMLINSFDFQPRTRLLYGTGVVDQVGVLARELEGRHVLLVTDPGVVRAGHAQRVIDSLKGAGLVVEVFDRVFENPTVSLVQDCAEMANEHPVDLIIGLGGGSSLDTARGCNFVCTNGGTMRDYHGTGKASRPMLPMIAIPTTAGTGSECQSFALISDDETHVKMACGDPKAAARAAILDPTLTLSQPPHVTACTGIDAIAHAVESAVSRKRNALSFLYSKEAFVLTQAALPQVIENPEDLSARGAMLLGASYAGIAIENSMLGAAHATANPLTANYDVIHGQAVGVMLPHVVRYNLQNPDARETYRQLALAAGLTAPTDSAERACERFVRRLHDILSLLPLKQSLSDLNVAPENLPQLAKEAADQWTGKFNPEPVNEESLQHIYSAAV